MRRNERIICCKGRFDRLFVVQRNIRRKRVDHIDDFERFLRRGVAAVYGSTEVLRQNERIVVLSVCGLNHDDIIGNMSDIIHEVRAEIEVAGITGNIPYIEFSNPQSF